MMSGITLIGIIIIAGFVLGELADKLHLPKVTGYIIAGILLSPPIAPFVSDSFVEHTKIVTNISLSIITFSVGGTLSISKIKNEGRQILNITLGESGFAFICIKQPGISAKTRFQAACLPREYSTDYLVYNQRNKC